MRFVMRFVIGFRLLYPEPLRLQWRAPAWLVKQARPQWRESTWLGEGFRHALRYSENLTGWWEMGGSNQNLHIAMYLRELRRDTLVSQVE